jgi:acyl transferase domain-containing protein
VSSFGIGGTNAHVVLEEAPPAAAPRPGAPAEDRDAVLLLLSAASESALAESGAALAARLEANDAPSLRDTAFTMQVGRRRLRWRRAIVAASRAQAIAELRAPSGKSAAVSDERRGAQVAFVFPGQGAQRPGMARALYEREPVFRETFDLAAAAMRAELGLDLTAVLYPDRPAGPGSAPAASSEGAGAANAGASLRDTLQAQPALFAVEVALARLLTSWGVRPSAVGGHSVGEYAAACIAGVMPLEDAASLVAARARLMSAMAPGAMIATTLSEADLAARLTAFPALSLAAVNGPAATVTSGPESEIARLEAALGAEGVASKRLVVSHAFHSAMMDPVLQPFETRARAARLRAPSVPMLSNLTGTWITPAQATDPAYWSAHLRGTVRFADDLSALAQDSSRILLELGPGSAMTALARRSAPGSTAIAAMPGVESEDAAAADLLRALGSLWQAGADLDWTAVHCGTGRAAREPSHVSVRAQALLDRRAGGGDERRCGRKHRFARAADRVRERPRSRALVLRAGMEAYCLAPGAGRVAGAALARALRRLGAGDGRDGPGRLARRARDRRDAREGVRPARRRVHDRSLPSRSLRDAPARAEAGRGLAGTHRAPLVRTRGRSTR